MNYIITNYSIICAITACFAVIMAIVIWRKHSEPGGRILTMLIISLAVWLVSLSFEYAAVDINDKIVWSKIGYIGILSCPVFFLMLTLDYNRYDYLLRKSNIFLLFIIPIINLILVFTNESHGLIWSGFTPIDSGTNALQYHHAPAFWVLVIGYSYLLMAAGTALLFWSIFRFPQAYRFRSFLMIIGAAAPWIGHIIYIIGLSPLPGLEVTPIILIFSGIIFTWNLYHYRLFDLVPIARDVLIETMKDGMLVLDEQNRIVDFNAAAQKLLGVHSGVVIGNPANMVFANWHEISDHLSKHPHNSYETSVGDVDNGYIELSISPIPVPHQRVSGRLIVMRDITRRVIAEQENQRANERLRAQLDEIEALQSSLQEQVIRDSLTGLFNRRYLEETLEREFARAMRENKPVSICMLDIDHFKYFNDMFGHLAGDAMLQHLGAILNSQIRLGDIACRYGGEEFVIVMPDMEADMSWQRAEQLRQFFEQSPALYINQPYFATFSCGVAAYPDHGSSVREVLLAADRALYAAKSAGRNRVIMAKQEIRIH